MRFMVSLLGSFEVQVVPETETVPSLERKTRAILAYLAATGTQHTRRALTDLFCQGANDPAGTLRWHLSRIRRQLHEDILDVSLQDVSFNPAAAGTDLAQFEETLRDPNQQTTAALSQAIDLYRGPFLEELTLRDAPEFELWLLGERTRLQQLYEKGIIALIDRHIQQQAYDAAIPRARQVLQSNALLETVHTRLVWLYAQIDQRDSALKQFESCQKLLQDELAVEPSPELQAIYAAVLENRPLPPVVAEAEPATMRASATPARTRFVGRTAELQQLQAAWRGVRDSGRVTMLVEAVAGGGKTRLVQEFLASLPDTRLPLKGGCYQSAQSIPYQPWLAILDARIQQLKPAELSQLTPAWQGQLARLLPQTFPALAEAPEQQEHLFRAVAELLLGSGQTPCILLIEDLQWADEASLQLFLFLGRYVRQAHRPALLLGTFRSEEADDNPALRTFLLDAQRNEKVSRLALPPLESEEIAALIGHLWSEPPDEARLGRLRNRLLAETGGNPLFVSEIVSELAQRPEIPAALPIPPSLQDLTSHRLHQLPGSSRQVIETLAVLDRPAHFELAQQISGRSEDEIVAAIERGLRWRFLEPHPATSYAFTHDLIRSAVRSQISGIRRQRLHHRAATTLAERGADAATLAYHWGSAGDVAQQIHFSLIAGNEALNRAAFQNAIQRFQETLDILPDSDRERRFQATLGMVKARDAISDVGQAEGDLGRLATLAEAIGSPAYRAEAALYQARFQLFQGELEAAKASAVQGIEWATASKGRGLEAGLLEILGSAYQTQGDYSQAQDYSGRALALFRAVNDRRGQVSVLRTLGSLARNQGNLREAVAIHRQALALSRELGDPLSESRVLARLADSLWYLGAYDEERAFVEEGLAVSREIGDRRAEAVQINNLAGLAIANEDHQTAITHYREALAIVESLNDLQGVVTYQNNIGGAYIGLGDVDSALIFLEKAINTSQQAGMPRMQGQAHHTRGRAYQLAKDFVSARSEFERALSLRQELGQEFHILLTLIQLVDSCIELADFSAADFHLQAAEPLYESLHDQVPEYVHQMFHYIAHRYHLAQGDEAAAGEHVKLAHQALQNRLAELEGSARDDLAQTNDSQLIFSAVARLGL
jgi:DNA-binding SARP family transcriptional activator